MNKKSARIIHLPLLPIAPALLLLLTLITFKYQFFNQPEKVNAVAGELNISSGASTNWDAAYSHISSNGSSHSYLNQAVTTTSAPTFATVNTGQGANELYDMNQAVLTTSAPQTSSIL